MPADSYSGTENYRADQTINSAANKSAPSGGGSDVGGTESPRAETTILEAANKAGGPTSGQNVGPTVTGAVYKDFGG